MKIVRKKIKLLDFQNEFVNDLTTPHIALVCGLGTGKTKAAVFKVLNLLQNNPGCNGIGCEPTSPQLSIFTEEMDKTCKELGIKYEYRGGGAGHPAFYKFNFGKGDQMLRLVSAKNYKASLVGYNAAFGFVDEMDTISNKDEGIAIWNALNDRLRDPKAHFIQSFVTSTPEGYHIISEVFAEELSADGTVTKARPKHKVIQRSTYDNIYLKSEYIEGQLARYSPQQAQAKIFGKFVNSFGQRVYICFERACNATKLTVADYPRNILHIGMDFNIGHMSATISVVDEKQNVLVLNEITDEQTTETMINRLKKLYPGRKMLVYPDSSGKSGSANSSISSITQLKQAGFECFYKGNNPAVVKERVPAVNAMFRNAKDERRCFVNIEMCPVLVKGLEQQGYVDGKPDKRNNIDHCLDAFGYHIAYRYPVVGHGSLSVVR